MPLLSYFAVAGSALLALLLLVDAALPPRGPLAISTEFHGVAVALHGDAAAAVAAMRAPAPALEPDMTSEAVKLASEGAPRPAAVPNLEPVNARVATATPAPKKRKPARSREWREQYAQAPDFGWNAGSDDRARRNDTSRNDTGRDTWRDTWRDSWRDSWRNESSRNDPGRSDRRWRW
jgi:hypothetical protein